MQRHSPKVGAVIRRKGPDFCPPNAPYGGSDPASSKAEMALLWLTLLAAGSVSWISCVFRFST